MRTVLAALVTPVLKLTGFRFNKHYRYGSTRYHKAVYHCIDVVQANLWAGLPGVTP